MGQHKLLVQKALDEFSSPKGYTHGSEFFYLNQPLHGDKEDGQFQRNAKSLFNLFILHDPLIHKIILTMQDKVVEETKPTQENNFNAVFDDINLSACTSVSGTALLHEKYGMNEMTGQEILQQVIHEDFKRIVDDMNQFRVETISQVQNKQLAGSKYAMCKRWVYFYQNMIYLGIFSLDSSQAA